MQLPSAAASDITNDSDITNETIRVIYYRFFRTGRVKVAPSPNNQLSSPLSQWLWVATHLQREEHGEAALEETLNLALTLPHHSRSSPDLVGK